MLRQVARHLVIQRRVADCRNSPRDERRKALMSGVLILVVAISSSIPAASAPKAQPATSSYECLEVPTTLLVKLRRYQQLVSEQLDARGTLSEIELLMAQMIRPQSVAESPHNAMPRALPHDSPLFSAGATCARAPDDERDKCELVYYDKILLGLEKGRRSWVRNGGWLIPFTFSPVLGGQSLSLGSIVSLGASQLLLECSP